MAARRSQTQGEFAIQFFLVTSAVLCFAGALAYVLIHFGHSADGGDRLTFPPAFWISTLLLIVGSASLHRSVQHVRVERQRQFRQCLLIGLFAGTLFVGIQTYGLTCLLRNLAPSNASTGAGSFVFVFAALHGLHFIVALLFVVFVSLRAIADRYDHEYYWGVTVCAYFWHFLGVVWACILGVFAIASLA